MIENANVSKNAPTGEFVEVKKYIGVASVNVVAVNPSNAILRKYGWDIAEDADEPKYVVDKTDINGNTVRSARVRFLVQIKDMPSNPIVSMDFWIRPEVMINRDKTKCKIIDAYTRTAWATKDELKRKAIPVYSGGQQANISTDYSPCHGGEEELAYFLYRYLNISPLRIYNKATNSFTENTNPGKFTIDNWRALCDGDVSEIVGYLSKFPDNCLKVILGVRTTEDNRTYQTFLNTQYIGNGALPDKNTGEYPAARRAIDKFNTDRENNPYVFEALPVREWTTEATEVKEQTSTMFPEEGTYVDESADDNDLPF